MIVIKIIGIILLVIVLLFITAFIVGMFLGLKSDDKVHKKIIDKIDDSIDALENKFIDENDFLLKIYDLQEKNPKNYPELTYSLWEDYLKNKISPFFKSQEYLEKFFEGKKITEKEMIDDWYGENNDVEEFTLLFNVCIEFGTFMRHKEDSPRKSLYMGYQVVIEVGGADEVDFEYIDLFHFFPSCSNDVSLVANLPHFDEFEFNSGMSSEQYTFPEFCELLSKTKIFNYKFLAKDQKENLARI
tara:strand:- start:88 stop:819 length:732 start_codon:yes stop_codon:yes gene_type:complete